MENHPSAKTGVNEAIHHRWYFRTASKPVGMDKAAAKSIQKWRDFSKPGAAPVNALYDEAARYALYAMARKVPTLRTIDIAVDSFKRTLLSNECIHAR